MAFEHFRGLKKLISINKKWQFKKVNDKICSVCKGVISLMESPSLQTWHSWSSCHFFFLFPFHLLFSFLLSFTFILLYSFTTLIYKKIGKPHVRLLNTHTFHPYFTYRFATPNMQVSKAPYCIATRGTTPRMGNPTCTHPTGGHRVPLHREEIY